ncbi:TPA: DUF4838 domain-containing protein [Candidatus Poribacteria bacterium]|nr:DUF4838 domain-containing protein [Candidatus Poribacteria bacterium]
MNKPMMIVESGRPKAKIVVGDSNQAVEASNILQSTIKNISGAELPITTDNQSVSGTHIYVGRGKSVESFGIEIPSGITSQMDEEGFTIRNVNDSLVIAGNEDWHYRGTIYAVFDFLEIIGCRWFFPGQYGQVIPQMDTISIPPINKIERPSFRMRNIWYSGWMPVNDEDSEELTRWLDCNKANRLLISLPGDGTITRLAPSDQYFDTHPHIYAVDSKGERSRDMLCLSQPDTIEIATETIRTAFDQNPTMFAFGFAPPDGMPMCHCTQCQQRLHGINAKHLGRASLSDGWFYFVNEVAKKIQVEFPDRWLLTNGYANRMYPPEGISDFSENIGIQFAFLQSCTLHRIGDPRCWQRQDCEKLLKRWADLCPVFIYDYDPGVDLQNLPFPTLHNLRHDIPFFKDLGVWGFWTEGQNTWMRTHLNYYVRTKLMWNSDLDVDAIVRDYCQKFYGEAAYWIEKYVWTLENAVEKTDLHAQWGNNHHIPWKIIFTDPLIETLQEYLNHARQQTSALAHQRHVDMLQEYHHYLIAFLSIQQLTHLGEYQQAISKIDEALVARSKLSEVKSNLLPHTPGWVVQSSDSTLEGLSDICRYLLDRTDGTVGKLVVFLPRDWKFKTDPFEDGLIEQWYRSDYEDEWDSVATTLYWENQGYQNETGYGYTGYAWYRTEFEVKNDMGNRPLILTFGGVFGQEIWVWINQLLVLHRDNESPSKPFDINLPENIQVGTNQIAVRIHSHGAHRGAQGGIYRRAFLWTSNN